MVASEQIEQFLRFLREAETDLHIAQDDEKQANEETQDILHRLELCDDDAEFSGELAGKLRVTRRMRRRAKDTREVCSPVYAWAEEYSAVVKSLERLLGDVRKIEARQQNRMYIPRTDILEEK